MTDAILGIDVSKETLDASCARGQRRQSRTFSNSPEGWKLMLAWLKAMGSKRAHVCMEATGRHSLGPALALHDAGHVVSVVNPAQIREFGRTTLGRNKTDKVDAALIREYAELFKPGPWTPPSPAMRQLSELQTVRAGIVGSRTEWRNRISSGLDDSTAIKLERFHADWKRSHAKMGVPKHPQSTVRRPPVFDHRRDRCFGGVANPMHRICGIVSSRRRTRVNRSAGSRAFCVSASPMFQKFCRAVN
jgi:transposase